MIPNTLITDVYDLVDKTGTLGAGCATGVDGLFAFAQTQTTECAASFYEPIMCLVLQGAKEAHLNGRVVRYSAETRSSSATQFPLNPLSCRPAPMRRTRLWPCGWT